MRGWAWCLVLLSACITPKPSVRVAPQPAAVVKPPLAPQWTVRRAKPGMLVRLPSGPNLLLGTRGERFLVDADDRVINAATDIGQETLVGAQFVDGQYRFMGEMGTVYRSTEPLGTLQKVSSTPLDAAAMGTRAIIGIRGREIVRSLDGSTWTNVPLTADGATPLRVAMRADGVGLILFGPGRLFATNDDGAHFQPVPWPKQFVADVNADDGVRLMVTGGQPARFDGRVVIPDGSSHWPYELKWPEQPLGFEHGAFLGDRWIEAVSDSKGTTLFAASLDGGPPLKLARFDDCFGDDVAATGERLLFACSPHDMAGKLVMHESSDGGATFASTMELQSSWPRKLSINAAGDWVFVGACAHGPCAAAVREAGVVRDVVVPGRAIAFDLEASVLHAIVVGDDGAVSLLRSNDGGAAFETLSVLAKDGLLVRAQFGRDELGLQTIALERGLIFQVFALADGKWHARAVPEYTTALSVVGRRVMAVGDGGMLHESADAGEHWAIVNAPYVEGRPACNPHGCFFGRWATRVGFELPGKPAEPVHRWLPHLKTPLRCELVAAPTAWPALSSSYGRFWIGRGADRWRLTNMDRSDGATVVTARLNGTTLAPHVAELLPPTEPTTIYSDALGTVALNQVKDGPPTRVATLVSWSAVDGAIRKVKVKLPAGLAEVTGRNGDGWIVALPDGYAAIAPNGSVVERMPSLGYDIAHHAPSQVFAFRRTGTTWTAFARVEDAAGAIVARAVSGGSWSADLLSLWPVGHRDASVSPIEIDDQTWFAVAHATPTPGAFLTRAPAAGAPARMDVTIPVDAGDTPTACGPGSEKWADLSWREWSATHPVLLGERVLITTRIHLAVAPDGKTCVRRLDAGGYDRSVLVGLDDLAHATFLEYGVGGTSVGTLRCEWASGAIDPDDPRLRAAIDARR